MLEQGEEGKGLNSRSHSLDNRYRKTSRFMRDDREGYEMQHMDKGYGQKGMEMRQVWRKSPKIREVEHFQPGIQTVMGDSRGAGSGMPRESSGYGRAGGKGLATKSPIFRPRLECHALNPWLV